MLCPMIMDTASFLYCIESLLHTTYYPNRADHKGYPPHSQPYKNRARLHSRTLPRLLITNFTYLIAYEISCVYVIYPFILFITDCHCYHTILCCTIGICKLYVYFQLYRFCEFEHRSIIIAQDTVLSKVNHIYQLGGY